MSYEGYIQCICKCGRYFTLDSYDEVKCHCGSKDMAMENHVDDTNCDGSGYIPEEFFNGTPKNYTPPQDISKVRTYYETSVVRLRYLHNDEIVHLPTLECKESKPTNSLINTQDKCLAKKVLHPCVY